MIKYIFLIYDIKQVNSKILPKCHRKYLTSSGLLFGIVFPKIICTADGAIRKTELCQIPLGLLHIDADQPRGLFYLQNITKLY